MKKPLEVVFCGDSIYLSGLAACLQSEANFRIITIERSLEQTGNDLKILHPEVVVFESDQETWRFATGLIGDYPKLRLIGVNPVTETLEVHSVNGIIRYPINDLPRIIADMGVEILKE